MKKQELAKTRQLKIEEIEKKVYDLTSQLMQIKVDISMGKEKNLKKAKKMRSEIAQLKTILTEKKNQTKK